MAKNPIFQARRFIGRGLRFLGNKLSPIPEPEPKPRPYEADYSYQKPLMKLVPDKGVILDVGSGHNPFEKATILSDRFLELTAHRRQEIHLDHRPFFLLDIHHLPFKDKSIDYLYCSHILEHTEDPLRACAEIMRVAKAGYLETPTPAKDMMFSWAAEMNHNWMVTRFGRCLIFMEYEEKQKKGIRTLQWAWEINSGNYYPNQDLYYPNQDVFNTILEWKDGFDVMVMRHGVNGKMKIQALEGVRSAP